MGVNLNIYIGPYIKIKKSPTKEISNTIYTCSNENCSMHGKLLVTFVQNVHMLIKIYHKKAK